MMRIVQIQAIALGAVLACLPVATKPGQARTAATCAKSGTAAAAVVSKLQQLGYTVQCGSVNFNLTSTNTCPNPTGGANPDSCYGIYNLPPRTGGLASAFYQLDDDEAVVTLGTMPPPVPYYGYNTIVDYRVDPTSSTGAKVALGAPFGPAMNQRNANPGTHAQLGGVAYQMFGQTTTIITTANTITQADVMTALGYAYGTTSAQNATYVEKLPVDLINLGSSGSADTLLTNLRVIPSTTAPETFDPAVIKYIQSSPVQILRVSPTVPRTHVASATYTEAQDPLAPTKVIAGQVFEQVLFSRAGLSNATQALNTIVNNVVANRVALGETLRASFPVPGNTYLQGRSCIAAFQAAVAQAQATGTTLVTTQAMNCVGVSPDADYTAPANAVTFQPGGEAVMVGVNHAALGSANFSNVALEQPSQYAWGLNDGDFAGTAAPYLGSVPSSVGPDFYVVSFNESCTPSSVSCIHAPSNTYLAVAERLYLSPATGTMPDYTDFIPAVMLLFSPPATSQSAGK